MEMLLVDEVFVLMIQEIRAVTTIEAHKSFLQSNCTDERLICYNVELLSRMASVPMSDMKLAHDYISAYLSMIEADQTLSTHMKDVLRVEFNICNYRTALWMADE